MSNSIQYIKVYYGENLRKAVKKKLKEIGFPEGYLCSPNDERVAHLKPLLPLSGPQIHLLLKRKNGRAIKKGSIEELLLWTGEKSVEYSFTTEIKDGIFSTESGKIEINIK